MWTLSPPKKLILIGIPFGSIDSNSMDSLNQHAQECGSPFKIVAISGDTHEPQKDPSRCKKCGGEATFFANFMGQEKYLCTSCAKRFMLKNESLPNDLWFCKKIDTSPKK